MAEKVTIARPYARAAFEYARERGAFAAWSDLLAKASIIVTHEDVAKLLSNPKVTAPQLVEVIADVVGGSLDAQARNFLSTLAHNRRLQVLPEIAAMYEVLRADVENIADVQVTSAIPLEQAQRDRLTGALSKRMKREVRLHCDVDSSLLGGAIVRSGDLVIDGSLKARLERLAQQITH